MSADILIPPLWTPGQSRFGAWWRRAKEWRASIATYLKYGPGGHIMYGPTGHLVSDCCFNFSTLSSHASILVVFSGVSFDFTTCSTYPGGGTSNKLITSSLNAAFTVPRVSLTGSTVVYLLTDSGAGTANDWTNTGCSGTPSTVSATIRLDASSTPDYQFGVSTVSPISLFTNNGSCLPATMANQNTSFSGVSGPGNVRGINGSVSITLL